MLGMTSVDIGIDLGTATVLVFVKNKGVVLNEPSVVAVEKESRQVLAIGKEARKMVGRTPGNILAIRPLKDGVIADYDAAEAMLKYFIRRISGKRALIKPRIIVCAPSGVTSVEKRAIVDAAAQVGARQTDIIEEPMAAALGAGLDIIKPEGHMVVDIGGGTTDVAVLSLGGIVLSDSIRTGGNKMDESIARYIKQEYNVLVGERTAEEAKIEAGTAVCGLRRKSYEFRGRDLLAGMPKTVSVDSTEICRAMEESLDGILRTIRSVLEKTPAELSGDISEKGIVITGGGALLHGIEELITKETGVSAQAADDPVSCVALGTGRALEEFESVHSSWVSPRRV